MGAEALRGTLGNDRDTSTQARTFGEHNDALQSASGRKNKHRSIPGLHTGVHSIVLTELMPNMKAPDSIIIPQSEELRCSCSHQPDSPGCERELKKPKMLITSFNDQSST